MRQKKVDSIAKELELKGVNAIARRLIDAGEMMRVNYPTQADLDGGRTIA